MLPGIAEKAISEAGEKLSKVKGSSLKREITNNAYKDTSLIPIDVNFTDEKADENHTYVEISTVVGKSYWLWAIQHFLEPTSMVLQAFCNMKWSIVSCPIDCSFPTSDNPVVVFCVDRNGNFEITSGISNGNNMVLFPVSPKKLLIGKQKNRLDYRINADEKMYKKLKELIVDQAFLYVFSNHEDIEIPKIRKRIVDESLYKQVNADFEKWYDYYIEREVPIIQKWEDKA